MGDLTPDDNAEENAQGRDLTQPWLKRSQRGRILLLLFFGFLFFPSLAPRRAEERQPSPTNYEERNTRVLRASREGGEGKSCLHDFDGLLSFF